MTDEATSLPTRFRVIKDPNFLRMHAESALVTSTGRDIEVALVATMLDLEVIEHKAESSVGIDGDMVYVELARLRLSPNAAKVLVNNVMSALTSMGQMDADGLDTFADHHKSVMAARAIAGNDEYPE